MSFLTSLFGGALPPALGTNNANRAIGVLGDTGQQGYNFMNAYGLTGQQGLNTGLQNLSPVANWFQTIMNGNRQQTLAQMQPQIAQIQGGLKTGLQTANTLSPRGGGRSSTLFDLPIEAQKDIASQYSSARAGAPAGLQNAATAQGALGASAGGIGAGYGGVSSGANNSLLNYGINQGKAYNEQAGATGAGIGKLFGSLASLAGFL